MNIQQIHQEDQYNREYSNLSLDLPSILAPHFSDYNFGNSDQHVFNLTPAFARFLLHNLKHPLMKGGDVKKAQHLCKHISNKGMAECWPKHPIVLESDTGTVLEGTKRLYALGSAAKGTFLWIEIV